MANWYTSLIKKKKQNKKILLETNLILKWNYSSCFIRETTVQQKSHEESLDGHLNRLNLRFELRSLLNGDWGSDDGARHAAGSAQSLFGADKHIWHVLVFAQERQVEDDLQWFGISSHHNKLGYASVQGLGSCRTNRSLQLTRIFFLYVWDIKIILQLNRKDFCCDTCAEFYYPRLVTD